MAMLLALSGCALARPTHPHWVGGDQVLARAAAALGTDPSQLQVIYAPAGTDLPPGRRVWHTSVTADLSHPVARVRVELQVNGHLAHLWTLAFRQRVTRGCLVAVRDLPPGRLLQASDFRRAPVVNCHDGLPVTDLSRVRGLQTRLLVPAGSVLFMRDLVRRPVVSRGDKIPLHYSAGGVTVCLDGVALRPAYPGQSLPVRTPAGTTIEVYLDYQGHVKVPQEEAR